MRLSVGSHQTNRAAMHDIRAIRETPDAFDEACAVAACRPSPPS